MVIALEGLPGVGKTTAAGLVADRLGARTVRETTANHPFLSQVYDDDDRDDLTVELSFLMVHANPYRRLDRSELTVCDFSPVKDELFAEDMLSGDDLALFRDIYERVYRDTPLPDIAVLLRAEPELSIRRVRDRMRTSPERAFEEGLTVERLRRMSQRYDEAPHRLGRTHFIYEVEAATPAAAVADELASRLRPLLIEKGQPLDGPPASQAASSDAN